MDCKLIEQDLLAFHFGTETTVARCEIEEHLTECKTCLVSFLASKRAAEAPGDEVPRASAKARLRRAVAIEVGATESTGWAWWERPFAFGMAAASLAVCFALWNVVSPMP
jgi:hypothetical protein